MLRPVLFATLAALTVPAGLSAEETADGAASASAARIERIERLLGAVRAELDTLKRETRAEASGAEEPLLGSLLSERQKLLARATRTEFQTHAAGYAFNPVLPFGLHVQTWRDRWGARLEGGVIATDNTRQVGAGLTGLYRISRYDALDIVETSLYGLTGVGFGWRRVQWRSHLNDPWFETPDRLSYARLGVGTELRFYGLGGVRFAPETGFQARRYHSRHEDSPSYAIAYSPNSIPESDFDLGPFFAFHISFYFR